METNDKTAENDAEIAKLTADNMRNESLLQKAGETVVALMNKMSAQSEEIKKLRALVKELADALEGRLCDFDCEIHGECLADMEREECESFNMRPLVARAREAIGGGVTKTVENCERMRCCEKRQESAIACESCIIKDSCETHKKEVDNGKKD